MSAPVPPQVSAVLKASDDVSRVRAWASFLDEYSSILITVTRRTAASHDHAMDRYAFILDQLRDNDFRRLRSFAADGRGKFTTWLVVVARRLCVDHYRHAHGRPQGEQNTSPAQALEQVSRRNLVDLIASEIDWEQLSDGKNPQPDVALVHKERLAALRRVIGTLDVTDRLLLTLRFEDDVPLAKIGPLVGLDSRWQVHRRLKAVLAQLREGLGARGITRND
jgi:RNA polymerase sigma factor (sigma-70 family)